MQSSSAKTARSYRNRRQGELVAKRRDDEYDEDESESDGEEQPAETPEAEEIMHLDRWNVDLPVAISKGVSYIPVRAICAPFGIAHQMQIKRLKRSGTALNKYVRTFKIKGASKRGARDTTCIAVKAIGFMLGSISVQHVREELREFIFDFQEDLIDAADAMLAARLGRGQNTLTPDVLRGILAQLVTHDGEMSNLWRFMKMLEGRVGNIEDIVIDPDEDAKGE